MHPDSPPMAAAWGRLIAGPSHRLLILILLIAGLAANLAAGQNIAPWVDVGPDRFVVRPNDQIVLRALFGDEDGEVVDIVWRQLSGPPQAGLAQGETNTPTAFGLTVLGEYLYECLVIDDDGTISGDQLVVEVIDCDVSPGVVIGTPTALQPVAVEFAGPATSELATPNPFLDYRLDVTFTHASSGDQLAVPGYFAADGLAGETSAAAGSTWRAHFVPIRDGTWVYEVAFRTGDGVAIADDPLSGTALSPDGALGCIEVALADDDTPGFLRLGRLLRSDDHVWRHANTGDVFLKGGANSPENLLAFGDFDATPASHAYLPHVADWQPGDPSWQGGLGKGLIGALNYLAGKGMNAVYFLTYNVGGDGNDVWPFIAPGNRLRYDCSKLDQWNVVFDHMDRLGIALHVVTQEQENDNGPFGLDGGALGTQRKLYYRELVARFAHHPGVIWNLGEENTNLASQRRMFHDRLRELDAYDHPIVVHTFPDEHALVYDPLLAGQRLDGPSLQNQTVGTIHAHTLAWRKASALAGRPWAIFSDEFGPGTDGALPDAFDFWHDEVRQQGLWGNLMAGGSGNEWYFGSNFPDNDLTCEDWRSRDNLWNLTRHALEFFRENVAYHLASPADERVDAPGAFCLAVSTKRYIVYLPHGGTTRLQLDQALVAYEVRWFDPRLGGPLQRGSVDTVQGPAWASLGDPPGDPGQDWAAIVTKIGWQPTQTVATPDF